MAYNVTYTNFCIFRCSSYGGDHDTNKYKLNNVRVNGTPTRPAKTDKLRQNVGAATTLTLVGENGYITREKIRQNIPTKKQFVDPHRQGLMIEGGVGYRQTVVIRSYEVGPDKTATIDSILNLFQVIKKHLNLLYCSSP
ncbi:palmitoyl-acyl carrier protein thioesterase chloroplastic [Tripterygium wilfordii]|uniref:Palmitoyl-acyl carrier protein thioesterase chloroplastic n=1 Tax=Tripterygium wilfordii TaxID=458696 RepID=A0A7J7DZR2_TRIWF|nr:palmitoyl-acyl carrier protein thioesterase chloroplastic [Tripterygium wilfordii]